MFGHSITCAHRKGSFTRAFRLRYPKAVVRRKGECEQGHITNQTNGDDSFTNTLKEFEKKSF